MAIMAMRGSRLALISLLMLALIIIEIAAGP